VDYRVSAEDRATFKRCRRQWDLGSAQRRNLQPLDPQPLDPQPVELNRAVREALAVYYYPGMWDWQSGIVLPLVRKAFMRSIAAAPPSERRMHDLDLGTELLERYFEWAPRLDDFGPLKIETDVEVIVPDPRDPERGLLADDGRKVLYTERVALVAGDAADDYWVVVHSVAPDWRDVESLLLDEAAIAACWAWEQTYLGMDVAGTIYNEMLSAPTNSYGQPPAQTRTGRADRGGYSQNEPSGGGRALRQLQRSERSEGRSPTADRVEQEIAGPLRRTRVRRTRAEIDAAVAQISAELLDMLDPDLVPYPSPSPRHCPTCQFVAPCLTMTEGSDPELDLASRYREGTAVAAYEPRLGAGGGGGRNISLPGLPPSGPGS